MSNNILTIMIILLYIIVVWLIIVKVFPVDVQISFFSIINIALTVILVISATISSVCAFKSNEIAKKASEMQALLYTPKIRADKYYASAEKKRVVNTYRFFVDALFYTDSLMASLLHVIKFELFTDQSPADGKTKYALKINSVLHKMHPDKIEYPEWGQILFYNVNKTVSVNNPLNMHLDINGEEIKVIHGLTVRIETNYEEGECMQNIEIDDQLQEET